LHLCPCVVAGRPLIVTQPASIMPFSVECGTPRPSCTIRATASPPCVRGTSMFRLSIGQLYHLRTDKPPCPSGGGVGSCPILPPPEARSGRTIALGSSLEHLIRAVHDGCFQERPIHAVHRERWFFRCDGKATRGAVRPTGPACSREPGAGPPRRKDLPASAAV